MSTGLWREPTTSTRPDSGKGIVQLGHVSDHNIYEGGKKVSRIKKGSRQTEGKGIGLGGKDPQNHGRDTAKKGKRGVCTQHTQPGPFRRGGGGGPQDRSR